ncbi:MAG: aminotransferase class III-fold pyridoxal phosphate-dependent enzyme, partial [Rhodospirillales bacterium]|nr:aminotransferase class III-fold pyridoxal phosphate-dependent enzyme [Rhodospirillales bacterium]
MCALNLKEAVIGLNEAEEIASHYYGIEGKAMALEGELDLNFRITVNSEEAYVLKVHNAYADTASLDAQNAMLIHLASQASDLPLPRLLKDIEGQYMSALIDGEGQLRQVRLLSWMDGKTWSAGEIDFYSLGKFMGKLDRSLESFDHAAAHREFPWEMKGATIHLESLHLVQPDDIRSYVTDILTKFSDCVSAKLDSCRMQVIHNDGNDNNVLVNDDGSISGLIDFGDSVYSPLICELGVAGGYALMRQDDPITAVLPLVAGYHEVNPLTATELEILYDLMRLRLAMSVCMAAVQSAADPENEYLLISQSDIHAALRKLAGENDHMVHMRFRDACGLAPSPLAFTVTRWLEENVDQFAQISPVDLRKDPKWIIDLDPTGDVVQQLGDMNDVADWTDKLNKLTKQAGAEVGIGRYREDRSVYTSDNFKTDNPDERRTVHLGIDIFMPAGTQIFAPLDGKVAAFHDNASDLDYGPIIILEHSTDDGTPFWTKYGHLNRVSLVGLSIDKEIKKGEAFARMGPFPENGNWPPHVHFQILTHMMDMGCDIHGVASISSLDIWESISPDPNLILGMAENCKGDVQRSNDYLIAKRQRHLSRNLSLSYEAPLKIVKGRGQYLYDDQGNEWLDMVNNVCHVGHCHPRVVTAGQQQMAQLNTNTRYLHDNVVAYSKRLLATFPDPLSVCFFVNSGSEANDLALRLARNYTGARDMLIVDHAYHGNLTSLIDISPYKFNGRGGEGCPEQTHICEMPDGYRGRFKYDDPDLATKYADDVGRHLEKLSSAGKRPAGFIVE